MILYPLHKQIYEWALWLRSHCFRWNLCQISLILTMGTTAELREYISLWFCPSPSLRHYISLHHWQQPRYGISPSHADECLLCSGTHMGIYPTQCHIHYTKVLVDTMVHVERGCCLLFCNMNNWKGLLQTSSAEGIKILPSSSSKTWSNPTFWPRGCFALEPQTTALTVQVNSTN